MPIYEYRCASCHRTFEVIQKVDDAPPEGCKFCSGPVEKMISRTSFQLKGGGWFKGDYGGGKSETKEASGASTGASGDGADTKGTKKTETASGDDTPKAGGCASGSCGCSS